MRISDLKKMFLNAYADYFTFAKGKKFYQYTSAITAGTTAATDITAGSFAVTTNDTGKKQLFVADGALWQDAGKAGQKVYSALLAQAGTAAPTATVFENNLGAAVVLARSDVGVYTLTLVSAFTLAKTRILVTVDSGATAVLARVAHTSANVVTISTFTEAGAAADLVGNLNVDVRVYP